MNLNSRNHGDVVVLMPQGRIDHASAEAFSVAMRPYLAECKAGGVALVIDFGAIEYISSVGLRAMMLAARQVKAQSGRIALAGLTPLVREVFDISRFNLVYQIWDGVDAAVEAVS
jgi:anti-anti-sigma factor